MGRVKGRGGGCQLNGHRQASIVTGTVEGSHVNANQNWGRRKWSVVTSIGFMSREGSGHGDGMGGFIPV